MGIDIQIGTKHAMWQKSKPEFDSKYVIQAAKWSMQSLVKTFLILLLSYTNKII